MTENNCNPVACMCTHTQQRQDSYTGAVPSHIYINKTDMQFGKVQSPYLWGNQKKIKLPSKCFLNYKVCHMQTGMPGTNLLYQILLTSCGIHISSASIVTFQIMKLS